MPLLFFLARYPRMKCEKVIWRVESYANCRAAFKDPEGPTVLPRLAAVLAGNLKVFVTRTYIAS